MTMSAFQLEGLRLLGYTQRESEFLFLVATHSGYFTNHQFRSFVLTGSGSMSHAFIRKLLERKHATYRAYRSGERVYRLVARKVYQAIARESLRTPKEHELQHVKTRLVALDFVLAHLQHRYIETETEKVCFFEKDHNVMRVDLPVKLHRARKSADVTPRYFVDRFPLFLSKTQDTLTFTYIDSGSVTLDGFGTHLRAYLSLFRRLRTFDFIYVSPTERLFQDAHAKFLRTVHGQRRSGPLVSILDYFRLRKAWDEKERVMSAGVVLLKQAQSFYSERSFEELYERWRNGTATDSDVMDSASLYKDTNGATFRTFLCGASLKAFLDPVTRPTAISTDSSISESAQQICSDVSIQTPEP